ELLEADPCCRDRPVAATIVGVFSNTDTVPAPRFAATRSRLPSPLRSARLIDCVTEPVAKSCFAAKFVVVLPGVVALASTDTALEPKHALARSSLPSPFKSPTAIETGEVPVAKS